MKTGAAVLVVLLVASALGQGCASTVPVKKQAYAQLRSEKTFERELLPVWKAIEDVTRDFKIVERDPAEKKSKEASLETDWIYTRSRDKYVEYKINGVPKRKELQMRVRYRIEAEKILGGTHVQVSSEEEIETLTPDGEPAGYREMASDSSRTSELLNKIGLKLLSR